jgi:hypothetical protein
VSGLFLRDGETERLERLGEGGIWSIDRGRGDGC